MSTICWMKLQHVVCIASQLEIPLSWENSSKMKELIESLLVIKRIELITQLQAKLRTICTLMTIW